VYSVPVAMYLQKNRAVKRANWLVTPMAKPGTGEKKNPPRLHWHKLAC